MADDDQPTHPMTITPYLNSDMIIVIEVRDNVTGKVISSIGLDRAGALEHAGKLETLARLIPDDHRSPQRKLQS